jgi:hypothetical protein
LAAKTEMALEYNIEPFKEPKGFLKILQWLFAICAFATTVNFSTDFAFRVTVKCTRESSINESVKITVRQTVEYPFDLDQPHHGQTFHLPDFPECKNATGAGIFDIDFVSNVKTDAEFFVTTGVLSFLYATALIGIYLFANKLYTDNTNAPIIDFVFTVIFAVFWLSGSAAWAKGLSDLKNGANPAVWARDPRLYFPMELVKDTLPIEVIKAGSFGGIVISILFGFINFILWAANLWFLYKETTWFESIMKNQAPSTSTTAGAGA